MSDLSARERLQPALLDRLTDDAPQNRDEPMDRQALTMAQLRTAVLRDLGWLLNTCSLATTEDLSAFPLAARSTLNFGVTGFTGRSHQGGHTAGMETAITQAIANFEPRIGRETIKVSTRVGGENGFVLRFEIHGELWAKPIPVQVFLETAIDLETRSAVLSDRGAGA
jgi:type VI secretion system protein ImpF